MTNYGDRVRVEIDASDAANLIANHSGQLNGTTGWLFDTAATAGVSTGNVWRSVNGITQRLQGLYSPDGSTSASKGIQVTVTGALAAPVKLRTPAMAVTPGQYVGVQYSVADSRTPADLAGWQSWVRTTVEFYDGGGLVVGAGFGARGLAEIPGADDAWSAAVIMRASASPVVVPAGAATARLVVTFEEYHSSTGLSRFPVSGTRFYVSKVMAVSSPTLAKTIDVPFAGSAVWQNIVGSATSISIDRGGDIEGVEDDVEAGTMTAVVLDSAIDPTTNDRIRKGRAVRVTAAQGDPASAMFLPIFTGRLQQVDMSYPGAKAGDMRPRVVLAATDAVSILRDVAAPLNYNGTYRGKVTAIMNAAASTIPYDTDAAGSLAVTNAIAIDSAKVWDQLVLARNSSVNAKLWVAPDGRLKALTVPAPPAAKYLLSTQAQQSRVRNRVGNPAQTAGGAQGTYLGVTGVLGTYLSLTPVTPGSAVSRTWMAAAASGVPAGGLLPGSFIDAGVTVKATQALRATIYLQSIGATTAAVVLVADIPAGQTVAFRVPEVQLTEPVTNNPNLTIVFGVFGVGGPWTGGAGELAQIDNAFINDYPDRGDSPGYIDGTTPGAEWIAPSPNGGAQIAAATSYLDADVTFGSKDLVNSLTVTRHNVAEADNEKVYGPYRNTASITAWSEVADDVEIIDGVPSVIAGDYLSKYGTPKVFPNSITFDADDAEQLEPWADIYDAARVVYAPGSIDLTVYVLRIKHTITPTRWLIEWGFRPLDVAAAIAVTNPAGGAASGPGDLIPQPAPPPGPISSRWLTANATIAAATWTTVLFDGVTGTETDIVWNTNAWTVPKAGRYLIDALARILNAGTTVGVYRGIRLLVNAVVVRSLYVPIGVSNTSGASPTIPVALVVPLAANDLVSVQVYHDASISLSLQGSTSKTTAADITYLGP